MWLQKFSIMELECLSRVGFRSRRVYDLFQVWRRQILWTYSSAVWVITALWHLVYYLLITLFFTQKICFKIWVPVTIVNPNLALVGKGECPASLCIRALGQHEWIEWPTWHAMDHVSRSFKICIQLTLKRCVLHRIGTLWTFDVW